MLFDGILETTTTTGTGDLITSAVTGRPRFTDIFAANATESSADPFYYAVTTQDSPAQLLDIGIGWCSAAGTIKRAQSIATYSAGAFTHFPATPANLPAGTKNVICSGEAASWTPGIHNIAAMGGVYAQRVTGPSHLGVNASSAGTTKDRLYYTPIHLATPQMVSSLKVNAGGTAGVGGTRGFRLGLYASLRSGGPGRKLIESGDMSMSTYAVGTYSFSALRLPPGWYYGAFAHDYATTAQSLYLSNAAVSMSGQTPLGWNSGGGMLQVVGAYETLAAGWGSLPANAAAASSLTSLITSAPMIMLGLA